jgi:hypothetical protein
LQKFFDPAHSVFDPFARHPVLVEINMQAVGNIEKIPEFRVSGFMYETIHHPEKLAVALVCPSATLG